MTEAGGWAPDGDTVEHANLTRFLTWLADTGRGDFADYHQLWSESVRDVEWFWDAVWHFFGIRATTLADTVLGSREMPGAQWFPGATLNYVTEVFRHESDERPALIVAGEDGSSEWSWAQLRHETAAFANWMPLFVALADDAVLDDELGARITAAIRTGASPRHVPDDIVAVPGIPRTMTGKRLEIPIKRMLLGVKPADVVSPSAVDRPDRLDVFAEHART